MKFDKISIKYSTNQIPPPYSHEYEFNLQFKKGVLHVDYDLHYTDRDEIPDDEIANEGFTSEDDFKWTGQLNKIWVPVIKDILDEINWAEKDEISEFTQSIHTISAEFEDISQTVTLFDSTDFDALIQELIQAVYETAEIEPPLEINFRDQLGPDRKDYQFHVSFRDRSIKLSKPSKESKINWIEGKNFLQLVFAPDYLAAPTKPKKKSLYISFITDQWYNLKEAEKEENFTNLSDSILDFLESK